MIHPEELPRDSNGIIQWASRFVHPSPTFHGDVCGVDMRDGIAEQPVCGRALAMASAVYGQDLYIEPWGKLPPGFQLPEMVQHPVPADVLYTPQRCPWRSASPAPLPETLPPPPPEEPTEAAAPVVATETPAPVAAALDHVADEDLEALTVDELHALAEKLGVDDGRWAERRLIREIRAERARRAAQA